MLEFSQEETERVENETPAQMSSRVRSKLSNCEEFWTQVSLSNSLRMEIMDAVGRTVKEHEKARAFGPSSSSVAAAASSSTSSHARRRQSVVIRADGIYGDIQKMIEKLNDQWDLIDLEESSRTSRIQVAFNHLQNLLQDMHDSEVSMVRSVHLQIEDHLPKVKAIRSELGLPKFNVDKFTRNSLALWRALEEDLKELKEKRKQILLEQTTVTQRAANLARRLGKETDDLSQPNEEVVDKEQLKKLVELARQMETELEEKIEKLRKFQDDIRVFFTRMRHDASMGENTAYLVDVNLDDDDCIITESLLENMEAAAETTYYSPARRDYNEWLSNLQFAYDEEMMKLNELWDAMLVSPEERRLPAQFDPETQNDDAILAVRDEVERLQHVYEVGKEVFENMKRWCAHWNEKVEYEQAVGDVAFYKNRRGNLESQLKHQRALEKQLIPAAIRDVTVAYQQLQELNPGLNIHIDGSRLSPPEYIQWVMETHEQDKLLEKAAKAAERKRQKERENRFGSGASKTPAPPRRPVTATPTTSASANVASRRRPLATPSSCANLQYQPAAKRLAFGGDPLAPFFASTTSIKSAISPVKPPVAGPKTSSPKEGRPPMTPRLPVNTPKSRPPAKKPFI